ncbi:putative inactive serine protease 43 isoform X2 [Choloepus didactylus]|uniref:putative inactive serine protease 43 isoform X2 n=1 Tax=Choloepus didactylus TaxID=27675 RepID=UPI00189F3ADF|nr:putative inactive serine protease 43 isoform X2 [Choloepus didactylus]
MKSGLEEPLWRIKAPQPIPRPPILTSSRPGGRVGGEPGASGRKLPPARAPRTSAAPESGRVTESPYSASLAPECGQVDLKILGGQDAEEGKWPWQVRGGKWRAASSEPVLSSSNAGQE